MTDRAISYTATMLYADLLRRRGMDHLEAAIRTFEGNNRQYANVLLFRAFDFLFRASEAEQQARAIQ